MKNRARYLPSRLTNHLYLLLLSRHREYGTIDDVDIDLHINIGFLDVSQRSSVPAIPPPSLPHYYSNVDILQSNTSFIMHPVLMVYLCNEKLP